MQQDFAATRLTISRHAYAGEQECVNALLATLKPLESLSEEVTRQALELTGALKKQGSGSWLEAFLYEYGLDTAEGIAIMGLAEALLRIPDRKTADRLIASTFSNEGWEEHLGESESFFVNASSWGLLLTSKIIPLKHNRAPAAWLKMLAGKVGEPVIREALKRAMRFIGTQFVLGEDMDEAVRNGASYRRQGYLLSYDILGEGARSDAQALEYMDAYRKAIAQLKKEATGKPLYEAPGISVKLSALHPRYLLLQRDRVMQELLPRVKEICLLAKDANLTLAIDAEEAHRFDIQLELFTLLAEDETLVGWNGLGFVVQAYQKRAFPTMEYLTELAQKTGRRIPIRLVKGAYWDTEIKLAQLGGFPGYPVFTRKEHTDVSYLACAAKLLAAGELFYPQFATHNARTVAGINVLAAHHGIGKGEYEFQRLHGMGEILHDLVLKHQRCRIYAPVGEHRDLLAYLIRRLLENGANTSFVNLLMDQHIPIEELIANPVEKTLKHGGTPHHLIPYPERIYPDRKNSMGLDLGNLAMLCHCEEQVKRSDKAIQKSLLRNTLDCFAFTRNDVNACVTTARAAFPVWSATSVYQRADMLEKLADSIEAHMQEFLALLATEAGRTLADGIAEVREAADFCRYYALHAKRLTESAELLAGPTGERNTLSLHPRGVFACISPWNFPLAIFVGQMVAALATGNCVIAKPAEQTPEIARRALQLMTEAGIPKEVVQLLIGDGKTGAALVGHPSIDGVVFTGSHETATHINRSLSARNGAIVPLIAETGGVNCMVVDSSSLLEQAVDDIILSAFGSAGQRCSALRVLYAQADIADELLELLAGAMQELRVGNPADPATDIGPVIDADAEAMLTAHIERMKREAKLVATTPLPTGLNGYFVAPHAFEIPTIRALPGEIFGPVLHIVRFGTEKGARQKVADEINAMGYGLTFGMHSRIEGNIEFFIHRIRAGNIYINRSMIGATVGVQPFGGEGLSGTGPKAGGPHYLLKFLNERTLTINTAAIGGNTELLRYD